MSDRELLELAAKAARIDPRRLPDAWPVRFDDEQWNPLIDDGDAFRLAMVLRINIEHLHTQNNKPHGVNCWPVGRGDCAHISNDLNEYAAGTRRAIVRAAAAIGSQP